MEHDEYLAGQHQVMLMANLVREVPLQEMLRAQSLADTLGPIQDPTTYKDALFDPHERWDKIKTLTAAARDFQRKAVEVLGPLPEFLVAIPDTEEATEETDSADST